MIFTVRTLSAICIIALLTACQKDETAPAPSESAHLETAAQSEPPAPPIDPATLVIDSPFLAHEVAIHRAIVVRMFAGTYPNLSDEQKNCLNHIEGNSSYLAVLEPFFAENLSSEEIAEADAFYGSQVGEKFSHMTQRMAGADLPPIEPPTQDERIKIFKALDKPFGAKTSSMSDEYKAAFVQPIIHQEALRCRIV